MHSASILLIRVIIRHISTTWPAHQPMYMCKNNLRGSGSLRLVRSLTHTFFSSPPNFLST